MVCGSGERYVSLEHPNGMKLKESQVRWIVREKRRNEKTNTQIAESMGVTVQWVQKLWVRHKDTTIAEMSHPAPMDRPENSMPGRREHSAILSARQEDHTGAAALQKRITEQTGINIPHHIIHRMLRDEGLASRHEHDSTKFVDVIEGVYDFLDIKLVAEIRFVQTIRL